MAGGPRSRQVYAAPGVVRVGDTLLTYCFGTNVNHSGQFDAESERRDGGVLIGESRLDGFVSADTPYDGGWLVTPPIVFEGDRLELNVDTGAGGLAHVEIQDADGAPIAGFTTDDCPTLNGNSVRMPVRFDGGAELGSLAGRAVRLRIELRRQTLRLPVLVNVDTIYSRLRGGLAAETGCALVVPVETNPSPPPLDSRLAE